ncbi:MAG: dihydrofolate reductase family protein [Caldilinea sp.]|nr:dihydrofolate reductase family protein [Caldilinea sp.]MDW8442839.1 dihydrofolate reductase family protein [Caldilineaceae bacterium]
MTDEAILQLYPDMKMLPLQGLYLGHDLRRRETKTPFVYANFVASLDGRIAVPDREKGGMKVPPQIANERDWRLFQELAIQADLIITTGRYLRDYAAGKAQEILRVHDDPRFADLQAWRATQGLPAQPDLVVISGSLDFPIPEALTHGGRRVLVVTHRKADPQRVRALEADLGQVLTAGDERVKGRTFVQMMGEMGYRFIYSAAGPKIAHMLLADDALDRLYLTQVCRVLGGASFSSIVEGPPLLVDLPLLRLYYDPHAFNAVGQLFACYGRREAVVL